VVLWVSSFFTIIRMCVLHKLICLVFGINRGNKLAKQFRVNHPIKVFHVTGKFGKSTESHFNDSPITSRATFDHIQKHKINAFLTSLQASHQKKMYELCGVDLQSQAAYDLAVEGPIRPAVTNVPLIYSIKCIEFKRPYFTIGKNFFKNNFSTLLLMLFFLPRNPCM
jgi:mitochondrial mRNA pseudouridine synthase TRUB2